ncbi:hypothetical protein SUGI_0130540 [Cryptomeria japonica]|uniref:protein SMALL AUXIN UP-REGULATED RNA 51 n=1 Tax=Cryptomeria japonica TaxID=3369 RepID=UPI002408A0A9|nr:protein SMALL AUXIN UP-REGULATED RNA 51 [Cryptomeria japonica]GLJ10559.1 hypothetical protein SUGI_0130540 [Cryptomeria japonica]
MGGKKGNKIRQIVKLRQFVRKWRIMALTRNTGVGCSLSPRVSNRSPFLYDSDEECCRGQACPPPDVPEGYLAVYVGRGLEPRRFIIPTGYLSRPLFRALLDKAEEEFGFDHQGALTIPCEVSVFKQVLRLLDRNDPAGHKKLSFDDLLKFYSDCGSEAHAKTLREHSPAMQKTFG